MPFRVLMLASTALLAACATMEPAPVPVTAAPPAEPVAAATPVENAELAAFFETYDKSQLELNPLGKAYRGIVDEDYGAWGDFSDAARGRAARSSTSARSPSSRPGSTAPLCPPPTSFPSICSRTWSPGAIAPSSFATTPTRSTR